MDIKAQLIKFRYHILGSILSFLAIFTLLRHAPSFLTVIAYFWPLFLSTTLFLTLVLFFANTNNDAVPLPKPAEDLLDFVAGHHPLPEPPSDKSD